MKTIKSFYVFDFWGGRGGGGGGGEAGLGVVAAGQEVSLLC